MTNRYSKFTIFLLKIIISSLGVRDCVSRVFSKYCTYVLNRYNIITQCLLLPYGTAPYPISSNDTLVQCLILYLTL